MSDTTLKAPDHTPIRKADPFSFQATHKRMAWLLRLSVMTNFALLAACVTSTAAWMAMLPLKEVRVALLSSDYTENRFYRVEPISETVPAFTLALEIMARKFVTDVFTVDTVTQERRFREASAVTSTPLFKQIERDLINSGQLKKLHDAKLNRSIIIEAISHENRLPNNNSYIVYVDIVQVDSYGANPDVQKKRKLRVNLNLVTEERSVAEKDLYINPYGIVVTNMTFQELAS